MLAEELALTAGPDFVTVRPNMMAGEHKQPWVPPCSLTIASCGWQLIGSVRCSSLAVRSTQMAEHLRSVGHMPVLQAVSFAC